MKHLLLGAILLAGTLASTVYAEINPDKLHEQDIVMVKELLLKLEPLIKTRDAKTDLATLTFDELYAPLDQNERTFLKEFQDLSGEKLGVKIPFRGLATGKEDLVVIKDQKIKMKGSETELPPQFLPKDVYAAYVAMMDAMEKDLKKRLYIESGYRSSAYQLYLFVYYLKNHDYSIRETLKWVALPGYSEHGAPSHQAIDFINADGISGETDPKEFEALEEYRWLLDHGAQFGFVESYPKNAPAGITYEPWHWRFEPGELKHH